MKVISAEQFGHVTGGIAGADPFWGIGRGNPKEIREMENVEAGYGHAIIRSAEWTARYFSNYLAGRILTHILPV